MQVSALALLLLLAGLAIAGPSGLLAWSENSRLLDQRQAQVVSLVAERDRLQNLVDLLNPDAIVVGTIGRLFAEFILPTTRRVIDESVHPRAARQVQLLPAALGDATGDLASIAVALFATGQLDQ